MPKNYTKTNPPEHQMVEPLSHDEIDLSRPLDYVQVSSGHWFNIENLKIWLLRDNIRRRNPLTGQPFSAEDLAWVLEACELPPVAVMESRDCAQFGLQRMQHAVQLLGENGLTLEMLQTWYPRTNEFNELAEHTLLYLVRGYSPYYPTLEQGISIEDALNQMAGLSPTAQLTLKKLYIHGLRGEHIRSWIPGEQGDIIYTALRGALEHLICINHVPAEQAIRMLDGKTDDQLRMIYQPERYLPGGALAGISNQIGNRYVASQNRHPNIEENFSFLRDYVEIPPPSHHDSRLRNARLRLYEDLQNDVRILSEYGLTPEMFLAFYPDPHQFYPYMISTVKYLVTGESEREFDPRPDVYTALREAAGLDWDMQTSLEKFYFYGLRGDHLRSWIKPSSGGDFDHAHTLALEYLICERNLSPSDAIGMINSKTAEEVRELYLPERFRQHSVSSGFSVLSGLVSMFDDSDDDFDEALLAMVLQMEEIHRPLVPAEPEEQEVAEDAWRSEMDHLEPVIDGNPDAGLQVSTFTPWQLTLFQGYRQWRRNAPEASSRRPGLRYSLEEVD